MNYAALFRATLPETALEIAALLVIVIDLGFLRKAAAQARIAAAAVVGVAGCAAALCAVSIAGPYNFGDAVLMAAAGGLIISAAQDLLVIFVGLELLSLGLYILTAFAKKSGRSAESAIKYYLFGGMSAAFLLFGFSYLYGISGSTYLPTVIYRANDAAFSGGAPLLLIALVMIAAGLGFKIAAVPFHFWAPDTYEGAPAPAAAFIASVSKVASFALLISISRTALAYLQILMQNTHTTGRVYLTAGVTGPPIRSVFTVYYGWYLILIVLAVASMVLGNLAALAQSSVRRLLAYSAIAHAGYILLGLAFFDWGSRSAQAVLYYIVTYGLTTIGAFGVVGAVERATGSDNFDSFLGLQKRNPILAAVLLVLFLSLAGIPPLVGFWAKFNLFAAVLGMYGGNLSAGAGPAAPLILVALAIAMSAVSLYYYLQVLKRAYVMPAADESPIRVHSVTLAVLIAIAAAVIALGCFPALLQNWIASLYA
jgi:NADH-quinone oxidoreductase subunit N